MSRILVLHNSLNLATSATREMTNIYLARYVAANPGDEVVKRDLVASPIPHLHPDLLGVQLGSPPPQDRISADGSIALAETLIAELEGADTIVIGVPMYNFTVPSTLKAWIDHIVRAGRTFNYVDGAPLGLLPPGKKVILFVASGGAYSEGPMKAFDFIEPYLRFVLAFVGLSDVTVVRAEKQALPDIAIPERSNAILRTNGLSV